MKKLLQILLCTFSLSVMVSTAVFAQSESGSSLDPDLESIKELFSITKFVTSVIIIVLTYFASKILAFLIGVIAEKQSSYRLLLKRLVPFLNIFLWSSAIFVVIAGVIAPPIETVLTVSASIGIAVGFASQDVLKNIFGGLIIILDRPFQVGDKIEIDDYYGEVTEIGLRSTRIVTPDDSIVSVPNADIVSNSVSNSNSGALDCQVVASIYLPATTDVERVKEIAKRAAYSSRYVYLRKPVVVIVENKVFEQNFVIQLKIKAYVLDIRYEFLLKSEITELVLTELNKAGITTGEAAA